ncbi:MAG TPA: methylmalonyl-CoA decarboxylase [Streptosporangiaceae bacterium]
MDAAAHLADAEDQVIDEALANLAQRSEVRQSPGPGDRRRDVRQLFHLVLRCMRAGRAEPIIRPSERIAAHCYAAGIDLAEMQEAFSVLAEVLWRHLADAPADEQLVQALGLLHAIVGEGTDAMARIYVALDTRHRHGQDEQSPGDSSAAGTGSEHRAGHVVLTSVVGQVGIITLEDRHKHNAIGAQLATGVIAALESLQAQQVRAIVLRAAVGMHVWSAGHDIEELPPGRDPLGYNDPLEGLIRAVRTFPAPVVAMVHGTVWGGAVDLVLSCDLAVADETASFAITPANLGLPYNITGLLHFLGRLPINVIKEMFFTAAPIDARKAKDWLLINHLVPWDRLESFTLELAATMATKSPLAIAVIKEQLRVLSDYQPIAAQVYERVQGLRREAYDSSDYLEGLNAFAQKRQPIFRGT